MHAFCCCLGAVEELGGHTIFKILSLYKVDTVNLLAVAHLHIQQTQSNISIHVESCLCPPDG